MNDEPRNIVSVRAAVLDTERLTLYLENGSRMELPQGDIRLKAIIAHVTPIVARGEFAQVDLGPVLPPKMLPGQDAYVAFEKQSKLTKFFRVAKAVLFGAKKEETPVLTAPHLPPMEIHPPAPHAAPVNQMEEPTALNKAVDDIIAHATPAADPSFTDAGTHEQDAKETIIAVITNQTTGQKTVVPGVQKLNRQIDRAARLGSPKGVDAFMARIAPVMKNRGHSIEDLLVFMENGDLPIADDGCVIVYKVLKNHPTKKGLYVDPHSGQVPQRVGSYVHMDEKMVDPNRREQCSVGLHVARRRYLKGFKQDACFLAKVRPEEIVAVPHNEADKMRAFGYHLIFKLGADDYARLKINEAFTATRKAQTLLGRAIAGDHPPIDQMVKIGGAMGTNITVTDLGVKVLEPAEPKPIIEVVPARVISLATDSQPKPVKLDAPKVEVEAIIKKVAVIKAINQRTARGIGLFDEFQRWTGPDKIRKAQELLDYKKASKVGWEKLGLAPDTGDALKLFLEGQAAPAPKIVMAKPGTVPPLEAPRAATAAEVLAKVRKAPAPAPTSISEEKAPAFSRREQAESLVAAFTVAKTKTQKMAAAQALWAFKRSTKKSWDALGIRQMTVGAEVEALIKS